MSDKLRQIAEKATINPYVMHPHDVAELAEAYLELADVEEKDEAVSNSQGKWRFMTNDQAYELRAKLAGIVTLIPNGAWYPTGNADRALIERLIEWLR
jgi:hypothetical protein